MKLKRADEMEMYITFRAMRLSYLFLNSFLAIWFLVEAIRNGVIITIPFVIFIFSQSIFLGCSIYLQNKFGRENEE